MTTTADKTVTTGTDKTAAIYVPFGGAKIDLGEEAKAPIPENPLLQYATGLPATRPKTDSEGYTCYDEDGEELVDNFNYSGFFTPFGVDKDLDATMTRLDGQTLTILHRGGPAKHWMMNKATVFLLARGIPRGSNSAGELGVVYQWDKGDGTRRSSTVFSMQVILRPLSPHYTKGFVLSLRSTQTGDVIKALTRQYRVLARAHEELQRHGTDMPLPLYSYSLTLKASNTQEVRGVGEKRRSIYPVISVVPEQITAEYLQRQEMPLEYADLCREGTENAVAWAKSVSQRSLAVRAMKRSQRPLIAHHSNLTSFRQRPDHAVDAWPLSTQ
jgi:hypothetical protein